MLLTLAFLASTTSGIGPELEAVMNRRKAPAERSVAKSRAVGKAATIDPDLERCADQARGDSAAARQRARQWMARSDGPSARQCLGFAEAQAKNWPAAAAAFRDGARLAGSDAPTAARLWSQAGNAAMLGGNEAAALSDLDKALDGNALPDGLERGEAYLDRARDRVAMNDPTAARTDLDAAIRLAPDDPLVWLLSATLARRQGDLPLARQHIARATQLADDDASVALEAGVIAALGDDDDAATAAFRKAERIGSGTPVADTAKGYLSQLGAPQSPPVQSR